jgi:short-subunit dehydrogenase
MATALVTGGSSGIGRELASLLARDGHDLVLVARDEARLAEAATELKTQHGVSCVTMPVDLAEPDAVDGLLRRLQTEGVTVEVLVNNAGFGLLGRFADNDWSRELAMLRVNVLALTELTKRLLPGMLERRRGRILNVASTAGFQPGPVMAVYYATKAYVLSFGEALAVELAGSGVTVTTLAPGVTATGFQERAGAQHITLTRLNRMSAADAAEAGYRAMLQGKSLVVPGLLNKLGVQAVRISPRWVLPRVVKALHEH